MVWVRYCIVLPAFNNVLVLPALNHFWFAMLVLSVVLISAAGYLINDYFDVKADEINKPNKIIVGRLIKRRWVMFIQIVMNITGLLLGIVCAKVVYRPYLVLYHLLAICLLWYYSTHFKRKLWIGNIIIASLVALVCWIGIAFEWYALAVGSFGTKVSKAMLINGLVFTGFAFLVNWIREIVKDAEDISGDLVLKANTIPLKYGLQITRYILIGLCIITAGLIVIFIFVYFNISQISQFGLLLLPILIFGGLIYKIWYADTKADYHQLSSLLKLVMFFGILSMFFL